MFKLHSKSTDLKNRGILTNPIKYKFSINCSPNKTKYYEIKRNLNQNNSRNTFNSNYNLTSPNLAFSNNLNNQELLTEKVKYIINKETEGTITLDEILSKTTRKDNFRPFGYPFFSFSKRNLKKSENLFNKRKIYHLKNSMGKGERKLRTTPSPYITNNKNGNDNYEGNINGPLFLNNYENKNNIENNRYNNNDNKNYNSDSNLLKKDKKNEKNSNLIPIKPPRLTYCNLTSVKYNILSPHKKSIFKTHDEVTEYKIANIFNTPIKYGNNNQFNSTNYNELFVNSMN